MAHSSLRLRRAITLSSSSSLLRNSRSFSAVTSSSSSSSVLQSHISSSSSSSSIRNALRNYRDYFKIQSLSIHSSLPSSSSRSYNNDDDKISPDTILFEGCDYNHWLITMDFPKDPKPTPEEMVETYVQTLAKVVGSVEEAKKRMYACSTTTFNGFQAVMTEEMSEKFKGLPGVVFILPDSYIDPVNKEYGGDKYINGTIIPRPPPVQYGRQGRYGDRNRDRPPRNDRMPMQQGNQPYDRQGSMQGDGRNYGAPQSIVPQQNYGPAGQGERRDSIPMAGRDYTPGGRETYPVERRDPMPSYQRESNQGNQGNYPTQEQRDFTLGYQRNSAPTEHRDRGVNPPPSGGFRQGADFGHRQGYPGPGVAQGFQQNGMQERQGVSPPPSGITPPPCGITSPPSGGYGQAAGSGYRQGYPVPGEAPRFQQTGMQERQGVSPPPSGITPPHSGITPPPSGGYGQAADSGYRQGYPVPGEAPRFQQTGMQERQGVIPAPSGGYGQGVDSGYRQGYPGPHVQQNGMQEGQGSYMPRGQDRNGQGRY